MATTTTAINACDAKIQVDGTGGTLVDISGAANSFNLEFTQATETYKVFGDRWVRRLACGKDAKLDLNVVYTTATNEALDILRDWMMGATSGTPRTIALSVPSGATGSEVYTGEFIIESLSIPGDAETAGPIKVAAKFVPNGEVTQTVVS